MGKTAFVDNDPNPNDANKPGLSSSYSATFVHSADDDYAFELSQAEIQNLTKLWWDGSSANWTTDAEYQDLMRSGSFVATIAGEEFRVIKRDAFGDEDQQHLIVLKTKTAGSKRGALISHANYTVACSVFDEDKGYPEGAASIQHQRYAQAILGAGY